MAEPLLSFNGSFEGSEEALLQALTGPLTKGNRIRIITLTHHDSIWRFNGAICYENEGCLATDILELLRRDIRSDALSQVTDGIL